MQYLESLIFKFFSIFSVDRSSSSTVHSRQILTRCSGIIPMGPDLYFFFRRDKDFLYLILSSSTLSKKIYEF